MTASDSLISRLEAAEAGSRELDVALWLMFDPGRIERHLGSVRGTWPRGASEAEKAARRASFLDSNAPHFTTSLDAALALAERLDLDVLAITNEAVEALAVSGWSSSLRTLVPELARHACIAILKAKEASQ
jgi:hypothetical protein